MKPTGEWLEWEQLWQADRTSPERLEVLIERTRRARLSLRLTRRLSRCSRIVALAVVGAALRHGEPFNSRWASWSVSASLRVAHGSRQSAGSTAKVDAPLENYVATACAVRSSGSIRETGVDRHGARSRVSRSVVDRRDVSPRRGLSFDASAHRVGTTGAHRAASCGGRSGCGAGRVRSSSGWGREVEVKARLVRRDHANSRHIDGRHPEPGVDRKRHERHASGSIQIAGRSPRAMP